MIEGTYGNLWIDVVKYENLKEYHAYINAENDEGDVVQVRLSMDEYLALIYEVLEKAILLGLEGQDLKDWIMRTKKISEDQLKVDPRERE